MPLALCSVIVLETRRFLSAWDLTGLARCFLEIDANRAGDVRADIEVPLIVVIPGSCCSSPGDVEPGARCRRTDVIRERDSVS